MGALSRVSSPARKVAMLSLLSVTLLGFLFKYYSGPGRWWFNDYGAGLFYEIFWILIFFFIFPGKRSAHHIPLWVFVITSALEILQLYHPPVLELIRSCFLGKALIGTTFSWWDFPHYMAGCLMGWLYIRWIIKKSLVKPLPAVATGPHHPKPIPPEEA
ncbi:MAG: DUF2809 domain-containing protein [Deltaproteobacteria bacterium]|nr:DUF2809 domain-containing protein [Deltaproteobacteria bacterium]